MHNTRVEIDVGVQLAANKVVVFQCNFLKRHGQLEERVVLQTHFHQHFFAGFLHQLGAWVVVFVHAVAEPHQFDAGVFVFDLFDKVADFFNAAVFLNVAQHVQCGFIRAAVSWAPQAGDTGCNGCKRVGA